VRSDYFEVEEESNYRVLRLKSEDGTNRLSRACIQALTVAVEELAGGASLRQTGLEARFHTLGACQGFSNSPTHKSLIITGNQKFFSAGADLNEIVALGSDAFGFARMGQRLMRAVDEFPAPVCAAVYGYCMGGGLDLALACDYRVAHPHAVFGHRGAALGLITGWGGTQRLPRLVGRAKALEMFVAAEKLTAYKALDVGLVDEVTESVFEAAIRRATSYQ
jgi:enoyl-CoA hydratase